MLYFVFSNFCVICARELIEKFRRDLVGHVKGILRIRNDAVTLLAFGFYMELECWVSSVAMSCADLSSFNGPTRFLCFIHNLT